MDSTPVKRSANCNQDFANPHFKPLWEPDTAVGGNAIRYSLAHHVFQKLIANARLCDFCTDKLTRRVSHVARKLNSEDEYYDDKAFVDLFWQDADRGSLVAGETIVTVNKHGKKIAVPDYAVELSHERTEADKDWWRKRVDTFQRRIAAMDRSEAFPARRSWFGLNRRQRDATPWQTRFLSVVWIYNLENAARAAGMDRYVEWQEKYLNFVHQRCQCVDIQRLRDGVSFEAVLMERVLTHICTSVWEVIPFPPQNIWSDRRRFLLYFEEHTSGIRREESVWDYAFSWGENIVRDGVVRGPLPRGWHRRWVFNNMAWYHDSRGRFISRGEYYSCLPNVPSAAEEPTTVEEEDLIEL